MQSPRKRQRSEKQAARNARRAHLVPRRFRLKAATTEVVQRAEVWRRGGGVCYICSEPVSPSDWHADHVIPIFKGGQHCYANLRVAHPRCNLTKADADPRDDGSPYDYLWTGGAFDR